MRLEVLGKLHSQDITYFQNSGIDKIELKAQRELREKREIVPSLLVDAERR
jgi:hypothetical protein